MMIYHELRDNVPYSEEMEKALFEEERDVIVAGLGCAGTFCALSAAREGAGVLGLERGTCPGGMSVQGCVNGYYYGTSGGTFEDADGEVRKLTGTVYRSFGSFHPDAKKVVYEEYLHKARVVWEYGSVILGVYEQQGKIRGVRAVCGGKVREIGCKILVDATSDGHVLRICGVKGRMGRGTDGSTQPFSSVRMFVTPNESIGRTNHDSGYIDPYDDEAFSYAVIAANASHTFDMPLKDGNRFLYLATQIGIREGLQFEGEEKMTLEAVLDQKPVEKILLYCYSDIDKHGVDLAFDEPIYQDWFMASNLSTVTVKIPVPMGAVIPKGFKGLLTAGRCLSADNYVASAVRMNRDMYRMGEACGIAASLALKTDGDLLTINYPLFKKKLEENGCFEAKNNRTLGFESCRNDLPYMPVRWMTNPDDIEKMLKTDTPGIAIWSCRRLGREKIGDYLTTLLTSTDEMLRYNAAIALGITGDERALPVLREIVKKRSCFHYKDCRRSNQIRSVIAVYLCGKLGDTEIVPELCAMLQPKEFENPIYHTMLEPNYKFSIIRQLNSVYFQHFSNAVASLLKIAKQNPQLREQVRQVLTQAVEDESYICRMTSEDRDGPYFKAALRIKQFAVKI